MPPGMLGCAGTRAPLLNDGLAGYWAFNDGAPRATDSSPAAGHGTIEYTDQPAYVKAVIGAGLALDGATGTVRVPASAFAGGALAGDISVELWLSAADCAARGAVVARGPVGGPGFALRCTADQELQLEVRSENEATASVGVGLPALGAWHHVVGVRRGSIVELYLDGAMGGTGEASTLGEIDPETDLLIGYDEELAHFAGAVDEVRVWSRALSAAEIAALHAHFRPGVIAHWGFEGSTGGAAGLPYQGKTERGVAFDQGRIGQALSFDGADGSVTFDLPDVFSGTYSAEVWFQTKSTGGLQAILNREVRPRAPIHLWVDDARLSTNIRGDELVSVGAAVDGSFTDGCWHHAVVVREGGDLEAGRVSLYIDGELGASTTGTFGATAVDSVPFEIGYRLPDDPRPFGGRIDEVRVYDRALTGEEVRGLHAVAR